MSMAAAPGIVGAAGWVLDYASGSFSRSASAWRQMGAPTDGSSAFLATVGGGNAVYEDLGDGAGPLLRIEGARTNLLLRSRDMGNAAWTAGTGTLTANDVASPDASTSADREAGTSAQFSAYQSPAVAAGSPYTASAWVRSHSGTGVARPALTDTAALVVNGQVSVPTTYQRLALTGVPGASPLYWIPSDGRVVYGGSSAASFDCCFDLHQMELGRFPSSPIDTAGASATRDADVLTFTLVQVPPSLFSRAARFTQVSPQFANTDLVSGDAFWLWAVDSSNGVRIRHNGTDIRVEAVAGGAVKASSGALTFARNALLGEVKWDPAAAVVSVGGVAGSTGTAWSWTAAAIRVGGIPSAAGEAFCRLGLLRSA